MTPEKAAIDVLTTQFGLKLADDDIDSLSDSEGSETAKETPDKDAEKEKLKNTPVGFIGDIKSLYQGPVDFQERAKWVDRISYDVEEAAETETTAKYALIVRKK